MFSRRKHRPQHPDVLKAWQCLDAGDVPGALRQLRTGADDLPLPEVALVVARAAATAGFDDLRDAATAVSAAPDRVRALYDYGYACVERGVHHLAVPALREALNRSGGALPVLRELISAYEGEERHREAVDALLAHESGLADWPDGYLLVFNAVMAGDLPLARRRHALLPDPDEEMWQPARDRQNRMLSRAAAAEAVTALDPEDLRGWQYVIGGTVLGTLSPYGYASGMAGRYAFLQDTHEQCLRGLLRLKSVLAAAELRPASVSLLPDRGSRILGHAAAEVLGLPALPFAPEREDTVVVAHDLNELAGHDEGPRITGQLFHRAPGQVLHEHAGCWTDPPAVTPDSVTLLHQAVMAPWSGGLRQTADGGVAPGEPDVRPEADIAADILAADPAPDDGDGDTPADPDSRLTAFVTAIRPTWLYGDRAALKTAGPVRSGRFG
ncbi:hypothetical protein [Streptomyces sp. bgisy159]|uniref:hypothetical protein n=1 Tax=Streptomyces sp. bgisy159 TaxID=3413795 RepID=UPI003F4A7C94